MRLERSPQAWAESLESAADVCEAGCAAAHSTSTLLRVTALTHRMPFAGSNRCGDLVTHIGLSGEVIRGLSDRGVRNVSPV
jgi:hypothetical protein